MVKEITPELLKEFVNGKFITCDYVHDHTWEYEFVRRLLSVFKAGLKFYVPIHLIPMLVTRYKMLRQKPLQFLKKLVINVSRSCLFLGTYMALFKYGVWFYKNLTGNWDRQCIAFAGFIGALAILIEPHERRTELAIYFLPKFLEVLWRWLKHYKYTGPVANGEMVLFSVAMSILLYCFHFEKKNIKKAYYTVFEHFL